MKDLKFLTICPDDTYYTWQVHLWLESLKELGHSDKAIVLIFVPNFRKQNEKWNQIIALYPEATFEFIHDEDGINKLIGIYVSCIRPYSAMKYFKAHPELKEKAIFYCDSDVIFTKDFDINKFLDDDVNYLSDTNSYINASYFDSKIRDVLPDKLETYKKMDVLNEACKLVGITREIAEKNNLHSGGAQYLLKNIDDKFWETVLTACISIKVYLTNINKLFFESEDKGIQSWCADMWAVLWVLWARGAETRVVKELNFAWAPDPISKLSTHPILHNAGITGPVMGTLPYFYKGAYHTGKDPFNDPHLKEVIEKNPDRCTAYYVKKLLELKEKYKLNY